MARKNLYLDSVIPYFYQRKTLDTMIFTFIDTYRFAEPSVTIKEAAQAFLIRYKISEDFFDLKSIITTYERTLKDYYDSEKEANQRKKETKEGKS